ncbi:PIG-L deacetylase family protein [Tunturiibacter lichenicola]|uniref:PIG-L deacetylase family protein n=1 Tax=Tunturiibacter lichenicola TaxID=2051959 RepID=UPI0021B1F0B5|nr:PIG-L family deacetylase [Edaphobacter lichenicola]
MGLKLMCVVAHPDDECYAFGGALALAADRGVETYVVCLTDGQAATNRGDASSADALGKMRRDEFSASCKVLGVSHHELLDYQDGQLEFVNFSLAAGRLVERIRRYKPDVVITFGGDGGPNTHPDHMMVSMLTTAAFHWAGQAKRYRDAGALFKTKRLYYVTANFHLPDRPPAVPMPWTVNLDIRAVRERKIEAFRQHVSQAPLLEKTKEIFERYGAEEFYTLVAAAEPQAARLTTNLFDGLE